MYSIFICRFVSITKLSKRIVVHLFVPKFFMDLMFLEPLYCDEFLIAVNKPAGLPVHKNEFMSHDAPYLTKLLGDQMHKWIYNVHRIDAKTSGVILFAFSSEVAHHVTLQFEKREVEKNYIAIVSGNPGEGVFQQEVLVKKTRNSKKPAKTGFKTLKTIQCGLAGDGHQPFELSLVEINPFTGRWHQIRQHFAQNRFEIIGDTHHGDFSLNKLILAKTGIRRLFLHASRLKFLHPITNQYLEITADEPDEFNFLLSCMLAD